MTNAEFHGMHYGSGAPLRVRVTDGKVTQFEECEAPAAARTWIAPALFDIQVNGYSGIDFQQDNLSVDDLLTASRALRRDGCTRFFFTLITAEWPLLLERLRRARTLRDEHPELRHAIAGWHIEGPFLSDKPGFCGAHDPTLMLDPSPEHMQQLREAVAEDALLVTLAPERSGAIEAIKAAKSVNITVSLGHTDAPAEVLKAAAEAGATGFTHLANGCPRELDRHDNIIWRVCDNGSLIPSFIPDGIHVSPAPFRLMHRLVSERPCMYTTDAMSAAGAAPGRYRIGKIEVAVGADQIVRQPGKTNFAGSALRPIQAPFRAARMLGRRWQECWKALSETPARFVGMQHQLSGGQRSDICVVETSNDGECRSVQTFVRA